jgi:hypothetical protein
MTPPSSDRKKDTIENAVVKVLNPAPMDEKRIDMREIGFRGSVSETALEEIEQNDMRAQRVVTTAARFAFR